MEAIISAKQHLAVLFCVIMRQIANPFARPAAFATVIYACVLGCVGMSVGASGNGLPGNSRSLNSSRVTETAAKIDQARDRLQVSGVDATTHAALMVKLKAFRDWPNVHFVRESVCPMLFSVVSDFAVASIGSAEPQPTSGHWFRGNETPESFSEWGSFTGHLNSIQETGMAYQGNAYDLADVMVEFSNSGLAVSLCSIQAPDGLNGPSGAPSGNYVAVSGLQSIPCMDAPEGFGPSIMANEQRAQSEVESSGLRHVLLNGNYPQLGPATNWGDVGWQAVLTNTVTGQTQTYDIAGAEPDSQGTQTRLRLRVVTL